MMNNRGQMMDLPIKLVMALVVGMLCLGVLSRFIGTAQRSIISDMRVNLRVQDYSSSKKKVLVEVYDASSGVPLNSPTIEISYPAGRDAITPSGNSASFIVPSGVIATVRVTAPNYLPWEGQIAVR
ncbi:MAG: hypothetical protein QXU01_00250 [Candidatus Hadarchaeales archaeon]